MKKTKLPGFPGASAWERAWQKHWSKVGLPGYELPVGGRGGDERDFLAHARTPDKERARLKRINDELVRGFKGLFHVGPAVTVFGSARFKPAHPYYQLARATGAELARAGFATLTGGGPGIMEAANRGAHEAGGASYGLNIILPREQSENPYVDKSIEFQYFFTRKVCLVKCSCAFIVKPGGLGTLDELFEIGDERTFQQDPKYAIRILVDIAIKALSSAINDPTTAVQALDYVEDLLLRLGRRRLDLGDYHDHAGQVRLVVPFPTWDDFLLLGLDEIRAYGAGSVQVMRRMKALINNLTECCPPDVMRR